MSALALKQEPDQQITEQKAPANAFDRMPGESALWFRRFRSYRLLGPKRSLRAALEFDEQDIKVLKGTRTEEKPEPKGRKRAKKDEQKPELKVVKSSVPGSWKRASVQWHWRERAKAWDEYFVAQNAERSYKELVNGADKYLLACDRVYQLSQLYRSTIKMMNDATSHEYKLKYLVQAQSFLKDIRAESKLIDEDLTRSVVHARYRKEYNDLTLDEFLERMRKGASTELKKRGVKK